MKTALLLATVLFISLPSLAQQNVPNKKSNTIIVETILSDQEAFIAIKKSFRELNIRIDYVDNDLLSVESEWMAQNSLVGLAEIAFTAYVEEGVIYIKGNVRSQATYRGQTARGNDPIIAKMKPYWKQMEELAQSMGDKTTILYAER